MHPLAGCSVYWAPTTPIGTQPTTVSSGRQGRGGTRHMLDGCPLPDPTTTSWGVLEVHLGPSSRRWHADMRAARIVGGAYNSLAPPTSRGPSCRQIRPPTTREGRVVGENTICGETKGGFAYNSRGEL